MTITALIDAGGAVFCPKCGYVMFGQIHDADVSKHRIRCVNDLCEDHGKQFLMPRTTVELTPLDD